MKPGTYQILTIQSRQKAGLRLAHPSGETLWLPAAEAQPGWRPGQEVEVFVYQNREHAWVATTAKPLVTADQVGYLSVKSLSPHGAFLDWGLDKDLLVPHAAQKEPMQVGLSYLVYVYQDPRSGRLTASAYLDRHLRNEVLTVAEGDEVDLIIWEPSDLGVKVVVNQRHIGLVYANEIFATLRPGAARRGYVKAVRPDNKLDISLQAPGYQAVEDATTVLLRALQAAGGYLPLTDKSPPADISRRLEMSKKVFKKAVGALYRDRKIQLEAGGIRLLDGQS